MNVIGLTGGIGCGKTTVAKYLQSLGAEVINADEVGHWIIEPGKAGYQAVIERFGEEIIGSHGVIDRGKLGNIVFSDAQALEALNDITHPLICRELKGQIKQKKLQAEEMAGIQIKISSANTAEMNSAGLPLANKVLVIEAALLIELELNWIADVIWLVTADQETRIKRIMHRNKFSRQQVLDIIASQQPQQELEHYADIIIDNSSDFEHTKKEIDDIISWLIN